MRQDDDTRKGEAKMIKCAAELALKADAHYAPMYSSIVIIPILAKYLILLNT